MKAVKQVALYLGILAALLVTHPYIHGAILLLLLSSAVYKSRSLFKGLPPASPHTIFLLNKAIHPIYLIKVQISLNS